MVATAYMVLSLLGLISAVNAVRPPLVDARPGRRPPWLPVMLATETAPLRLLWRVGLTAGAWSLGALDTVIGRIGLAMTVASVLLLAVSMARSLRSKRTMEEALAAGGVAHRANGAVEWVRALSAWPYRVPRDIERISVEYAPGLVLDIYRLRRPGIESRPEDGVGLQPAVFQVHGGGWHGGNRRQSGRPLLHRVARQGWIGVAADYPLAPAATWPEPILALKRAVWWMKTAGGAFGIDPAGIVVTGSSAGAHLAAHLALTAGHPGYQPGLEDADLSVAGAVPFYGIFDLLNRNRTRDPWPFIAVELMKSTAATDEARWRSASPFDLAGGDAPPFLVIHGSHDALVPARESRQFVEALRAGSPQTVIYAEIPGATHGFDIVESVRTHHVIAGVMSFVASVTGAHPPGHTRWPTRTRSTGQTP